MPGFLALKSSGVSVSVRPKISRRLLLITISFLSRPWPFLICLQLDNNLMPSEAFLNVFDYCNKLERKAFEPRCQKIGLRVFR